MTAKFDFSAFPRLETQRMILREVTEADAEDIFALRSDYAVTKLNFGDSYKSVGEAEYVIRRMREGFADRSHLRFGIVLHGEERVIGLIGFNYFNFSDNRAAVGFDLHRSHWGRGLMTEALSAVLGFGFEEIGLNRIEADCSIMNLASQRVLAKAGFTCEGRLREQYRYNGLYYDLLLWSILRREWEAAGSATRGG